MQFSKTSPLKSGESSEKSSGENRVEFCHVCGCHGFFGPEKVADFESRFPYDSYGGDRAASWPFFRRRILGRYPAAPCSSGPFVLLLSSGGIENPSFLGGCPFLYLKFKKEEIMVATLLLSPKSLPN